MKLKYSWIVFGDRTTTLFLYRGTKLSSLYHGNVVKTASNTSERYKIHLSIIY